MKNGTVGNRHHPISHLAATVRIARDAAPGYWKQMRSERHYPTLPAPFRPDPSRWPDSGLHAAWLGHSTVLLKIDGFTILTDPVLGERVGVNVGSMTVGIRRMVEPALPVRSLPPIDLILLSHAHFDHFDRWTLRHLQSPGTSVVTASRTSNLLRISRYARVAELGWEESVQIGPVRVKAFEVNHWGARIRTDTYRGYNGYLIESGGYRVVFGGDTAYTDAFRHLRSHTPVDLAIMPIGAYDPWIHVHCNPEQAHKMACDMHTNFILPIHHQTFRLGRERFHEPVERLLDASGRETGQVVVQQIGQEWGYSR